MSCGCVYLVRNRYLFFKHFQELSAPLLVSIWLADSDLLKYKGEAFPGAFSALWPKHGMSAQDVEFLWQILEWEWNRPCEGIARQFVDEFFLTWRNNDLGNSFTDNTSTKSVLRFSLWNGMDFNTLWVDKIEVAIRTTSGCSSQKSSMSLMECKVRHMALESAIIRGTNLGREWMCT